jgi:glycosyltransferase involved in cell wall biosynthesis
LAGIFFKEQAEALSKAGNKIGVVSISEIHHSEVWKSKKLVFNSINFNENNINTYRIQIPYIPKFPNIRRRLKLFIFKIVFKKYIKKHSLPDIVHLHSFMSGEFAIWIKEKYNIPYVVTEHFSGFARKTISVANLNIAKKIYSLSSYNIAVSEQFKNLLHNEFDICFNYIPNIVNIDFFNVKEKKATKQFNFINIAFLDTKKNQAMLIRAFTKSFKNQLQVRLTIVGNGQEYSNLKNLIKKLNMEDQIFLYGKANREEVKMLLQKSDAFVLSSQYETFGVVVIEAMSCGLPVIATKCGGPESIITLDKIGLLSDMDENDLSNKLTYMYKNKSIYDSDYIRNHVVKNFSEETVVNQLIKIYKVVKNEK